MKSRSRDASGFSRVLSSTYLSMASTAAGAFARTSRVARGEPPHRPVRLALQAAAGAGFAQLRVIQGAQVGDVAVGEEDFQLQDVVDGLAVDDGVRAGRVVRDHAADRGAVGGRDVGR